MSVTFGIRGRLGNAIFRYMAASVICIICKVDYHCDQSQKHNGTSITDEDFFNISKHIINGDNVHLEKNNYFMTEYYQHDEIYQLFKDKIITFINDNPEHIVITDGINPGDGNLETFKMYDILHTRNNFNKSYDRVLHLRLEDFVTHNMYLPVDRILSLLDKHVISNDLCIVCKFPTTEFEKSYIEKIKAYLHLHNITPYLEHNDILTDYYIMKEAKTLICSKSTLSWCAAFFSTTIKYCYLPDYKIKPGRITCKRPISNTTLY